MMFQCFFRRKFLPKQEECIFRCKRDHQRFQVGKMAITQVAIGTKLRRILGNSRSDLISGQKVFVSVPALRRPDVVVDVRRLASLPEVQVRRENDERLRSQNVRWKLEMQPGAPNRVLKFTQNPNELFYWFFNRTSGLLCYGCRRCGRELDHGSEGSEFDSYFLLSS